MNDSERFWSKVEKTKNCWQWKGPTCNGYGRFGKMPAHRFSYEVSIGPIPDGLHLDHLCRNRGCVNPNHLEPVTNKENVLRGFGPPAVNARKKYCPMGHKYGTSDTYISPAGDRRCKACKNLKARLERAEMKYRGEKRKRKLTHNQQCLLRDLPSDGSWILIRSLPHGYSYGNSVIRGLITRGIIEHRQHRSPTEWITDGEIKLKRQTGGRDD